MAGDYGHWDWLDGISIFKEANMRDKNAMNILGGTTESDPVNSPSHYTMGGIEVLDAIEAWGLDNDAYLFNAIKYIARAGKKDPAKYLQDLEKAQFYLNRKIANLKKESQ